MYGIPSGGSQTQASDGSAFPLKWPLSTNPCINVTPGFFFFSVQKHFFRSFSVFFLEHVTIKLWTIKRIEPNLLLNFHVSIQISHEPWVILTQL